MHLRAERREDPGQLHRDEAATHDDERAWRRGVAQSVLRGVGQFGPGNVGDDRDRARRDHEVVGREYLVADGDRVLGDEARTAAKQPDATRREKRLLVTGERLLGVPLPSEDLGPVDADIAALDAELSGAAGIADGACGHVQRLLGDTASPQTGAADAVALDHRDLVTRSGQGLGRRAARSTRSDDHD